MVEQDNDIWNHHREEQQEEEEDESGRNFKMPDDVMLPSSFACVSNRRRQDGLSHTGTDERFRCSRNLKTPRKTAQADMTMRKAQSTIGTMRYDFYH
jgi:hypothetical protein